MEQSNEEPIRGVVRPDPTRNASEGDELAFTPTRCKLLEGNETVRVNNLAAFNGVLLVWQFVGAGGIDVDGTAVLVAPGIAVSAKHVVEPHFELLMSASTYSTAIGLTKAGAQIWTVRKVTLLGNLDLVILGLELNSDLPPDRTFRQASITTRLPKLGERLQVCGFRATKTEKKQLPDVASFGCEIEGALLVSAGEVTNRYPEGRDSVMLPWLLISMQS